MSWSVSFAVAALAFVLWLMWRKKKFSVLKDLGIPGPEPNLFFGNLLEIMKEGHVQCCNRWIEEYGRTTGYYYGANPIILVADVEILKKIQVSEFGKFMNRGTSTPILSLSTNKRKGFTSHIAELRGRKWKDIRSILTPIFTPRRMNMMMPIIHSAIDVFIENIDTMSEGEAPVDVSELYRKLGLDISGRIFLGIDTDVQSNANNLIFRTSTRIFSLYIFSYLSLFAISFPEFGDTFWNALGFLKLLFQQGGKDPIEEIVRFVGDVIRARRADASNRRNDFMQLMLDAEISKSALGNVNAEDLTAGNNEDRKPEEKDADGAKQLDSNAYFRMSNKEVFHNSLAFFLAGAAGGITTMSFVTHFLVHYPEVQERIRTEVHKVLLKEGELNYTSIQKLQYLDQVLKESLRMYPVAPLLSREIGEDMEIGNMKFKKGLSVQIPVYTLHRDPELWPDPESFDPERFSPENQSIIHPVAWQAFGAGPRNCVGMRFARMVMKLELARILIKYKLVLCEETDKYPITWAFFNDGMIPAKGVKIKAVRCQETGAFDKDFQ